jgi:hypothetical protein
VAAQDRIKLLDVIEPNELDERIERIDVERIGLYY